MILKMHAKWKVLNKQNNKETESQKQNRKKFLEDMKDTFLAWKPNIESSLDENNKMFLENMKKRKRPGCLGPLDKNIIKKQSSWFNARYY